MAPFVLSMDSWDGSGTDLGQVNSREMSVWDGWDGYFDFFLKADGICSKVAGYAEKIHSETERLKSIWAEAENNDMSYLNLRRKTLLNLKKELYQ